MPSGDFPIDAAAPLTVEAVRAVHPEPQDIEHQTVRLTVRSTGLDDAALREHWPQVVRLAYVIVGDEAVAQELAQDAFVALHRHRDRVENPAGFLRTVVVNRSKSFSVRRSRERRHPLPPAGTSEQPEVDETFARLQRLPATYRTVLALRYYADLSVDEIASLLRRRPGTVKSQIHRGLLQLRTELERTSHDSN
jgi:RNA polymerase sigma factor (sigma-70 family)